MRKFRANEKFQGPLVAFLFELQNLTCSSLGVLRKTVASLSYSLVEGPKFELLLVGNPKKEGSVLELLPC